MLVDAIEKTGRALGDDIAITLDPATSEIYKDGTYFFASENRTLTSDDLVAYFVGLCDKLSDRVDRRRHGRGRLGGMGGA